MGEEKYIYELLEALLIYIVPVCYVKTGRYGKT